MKTPYSYAVEYYFSSRVAHIFTIIKQHLSFMEDNAKVKLNRQFQSFLYRVWLNHVLKLLMELI